MNFVQDTDGETTRLSNLWLLGKSFEIAGDVTLEAGSLTPLKRRGVNSSRRRMNRPAVPAPR